MKQAVLLLSVLIVGIFAGALLVLGPPPGGSSLPVTISAAPEEQLKPSSEVRLPKREAEPVELSEDEAYLQSVIDQVGLPEGFLPDYPPRSLGQTIAALQKAPLYATRLEAVMDRTSYEEMARLMEGSSGLIASGTLPPDYWTEPLTEKAVIWDPVGKEYGENQLLYGPGKTESGARRHYKGIFFERFGVSERLGRTRLDFRKLSKLNPTSKTISEIDEGVLREIELRHAEVIVAALSRESLVENYMDARALKVAAMDYVSLPFSASRLLANCPPPLDKDPIGYSVTTVAGWTVSMGIEPGYYPAYDRALVVARAAVQARSEEIIGVIESLP